MSDRVYVIDTSIHQPATIPWAVFVENGVLMGITKASMGGGPDISCNAHVATMKDGGAKVGLYHWMDPTQDVRTQFGHFLAKIDQHKPVMVGYDIEQWWANWDTYYEYLRRERPVSAVARIPESQWIDTLGQFRELMRQETDYEANDKALAYWARWVGGRYPVLASLVKDLPQWIASYILSGKPRRITWQELQALPMPGYNPSMPDGIVEWLIWQFTSLLILPGVNFRLDINYFKMNKQAFLEWAAGTGPGPQPDPDPEPEETKSVADCLRESITWMLSAPEAWREILSDLFNSLEFAEATPPSPPLGPLWIGKVFANAMHVRSGPGLDYGAIGYVTNGDLVEVWEEVGTWARISPGGISGRWCSTKWLTKEA